YPAHPLAQFRSSSLPDTDISQISLPPPHQVTSGRRLRKMPLGILTGLARTMRRKRTSSLDILSSKRAPRNYYKGKNCKPTGFHTRKGGYVVVQEKLPNYVLKPYVSQCPINVETTEANDTANFV
ncbi:hypothetical protein V2J09_008135, partial [Rumex salicifolius]